MEAIFLGVFWSIVWLHENAVPRHLREKLSVASLSAALRRVAGRLIINAVYSRRFAASRTAREAAQMRFHRHHPHSCDDEWKTLKVYENRLHIERNPA